MIVLVLLPVLADVVETLPASDDLCHLIVQAISPDSGGAALDQLTHSTSCAIEQRLLLVHLFEDVLRQQITLSNQSIDIQRNLEG